MSCSEVDVVGEKSPLVLGLHGIVYVYVVLGRALSY